MSEEKDQQAPAEDDPYKKLEAQLNEFRELAKQSDEKIKDLGARLTRAQQESAELLRFHKSTLPKINKTFEKDWEEDPEHAVESRVDNKVKPLDEKQKSIEAQLAVLSIVTEKPVYSKYVDRIREMASTDETYAQMTWQGRKGIEALFKIARAEELESNGNGKKKEEPKEDEEEITPKERAFSESSSPRSTPAPKARLTADQALVAKKLGVKPEDYVKQMQRMEE